MTISSAEMLGSTYERCVAALSAKRASAADIDIVAADAAELTKVEAVVEGVIKEIKHD
jgi:carbonic anhydrase